MDKNKHSTFYLPSVKKLQELSSEWAQSFRCDSLKVLIICRGPIRKEAIDAFQALGAKSVGILLSKKDSMIHCKTLAPEIRQLPEDCIHRIDDYTGKNRQERLNVIQNILRIAKTEEYNAIFAGYGFMAEDFELASAVEAAGLLFIGPNSKTIRLAGSKDQAKDIAKCHQVNVVEGINQITSLALHKKYPSLDELKDINNSLKLDVPQSLFNVDPQKSPHSCSHYQALTQQILINARNNKVDLLSIQDISDEVWQQSQNLLQQSKGKTIRLKAINGGGGKGQRLLDQQTSYPNELVDEILNEVNATGVEDDKNILLEYNIENPSHIEIQLIGNGQWCMSLGGRDCSLQMHEQKLVEISLTDEGLEESLERLRHTPYTPAEMERKKKQLLSMKDSLKAMELDAVRFGEAVGLDNLSTFECILDNDQHYFMEMNTRIQVEHRVTELCYGLKFTNPEDTNDAFEIHSFIQLMALLALHKTRLPKPERIPKAASAVEIRLNAMNEALHPHAGGIIQQWTPPIKGELRDDQGIGTLNPDTQRFMDYHIAGSYDSNIALLIGQGGSRFASFQHILEILRRMRIEGLDLKTNQYFLYGLISWILSQETAGISLLPTSFVNRYLSTIAHLKNLSKIVHPQKTYQWIQSHYASRLTQHTHLDQKEEIILANDQTFSQKQSLLLRIVAILLQQPHLLAGWLQQFRAYIEWGLCNWRWIQNPLELVQGTYHFLNMDTESRHTYRDKSAASYYIWDHDDRLLKEGLEFYQELHQRLDCCSFHQLEDYLARKKSPISSIPPALWQKIRESHVGYMRGTEILSCLFYCGHQSGFYDLQLQDLQNTSETNNNKNSTILSAKTVADILAPSPPIVGDIIQAPCGGTFYAKPSPDADNFVQEGDAVKKGQPLYILEVMKMFNTHYAEYAGTVKSCFMQGNEGIIIKKGQDLFQIIPDVDTSKNTEASKENSVLNSSASQSKDKDNENLMALQKFIEASPYLKPLLYS